MTTEANQPPYPIGHVKTHHYVVKEADFPWFEKEGNVAPLHKVMSTYALAREMEWAGRLWAIALKTSAQEGMGTAVTVQHKAATSLGAELTFHTTCAAWDGKRLHCTIEVFAGETLVASGTTDQVILPREKVLAVVENAIR